jgi:serine/threonine-protein kinase HipA
VFKAIDVVEVRIWDQTVGAVALDPGLAFYAFEYDSRFAQSGVELAPLHMPLAGADAPFVFTGLPEATYQRLPAMLADSLPDRFGNALVTAYLQRQGVRPQDITPLDRLAYMGKRSFGALEFRPVRGPRAGAGTTALILSELVDTARQALEGQLDSDPHATSALANLIRVGTSAGGARAKAAIAWNRTTREIRAGHFDVAPGFEHWLLKFDGVGVENELGPSKHYGRIEFAYSRLARNAGIAMSECALIEEGGRAHFVTRRFDREGNEKLHMQTLCALAHVDFNQRATHDYGQLMMTIEALGLGDDAKRQAFKRVVFNVMAANCDDHAKNISFLLRQGGRWELAPAYDLAHAFNPHGVWTYQHLMSVNGKFTEIARADLLLFADRFDVPEASRLLDEVRNGVATWPQCAAEAGLPGDEVSRVGEDLTLL